MCVGAARFGVQNTAALLILEPEFGFQMTQKDADDFGPVVADGRINMHMPDRPVCAPVSRTRHELTQLSCQVIGR